MPLKLALAGSILLAVLLLASWLLRPAVPDGPALDGSQPRPPLASEDLQWRDCQFRLPAGVTARCSDYDTGVRTEGGEPIQLPLVELRRDGEPPYAPLTIHLPGGPGAPGGTDADSAWLWAAWMQAHRFPGRLLIFDPRGTGNARPGTACPDRAALVSDIMARPLTPEEEAVASREMLAACRNRLQADGLDPADFAARHMLGDVPGMLAAVGDQQARLLGLSHGSRMALALLRQRPERFSAAVLDGVFPTDRDPIITLPTVYADAWDRLLDRCQAEPDCPGPALAEAHEQLQSRLDREPELLLLELNGRPPQPLWLDGKRYADLVFAAQVFDDSLAALPAAIVAAAGDDFRDLAGLLSQVVGPALDPDRRDAVYWASICEESAVSDPARMDQAVQALGLEASFPESIWRHHPCVNGWDSGQFDGEAFRQPVQADLPVLLLAGELDPVTPKEWARHQQSHLSQSHLLLAEGRTHGLVFDNDCIADAVVDFLRAPGRARLPDRCVGPEQVFRNL
ncbi:alpha/beta fold hydrolase [Gammaproteobacteria bacterium AB-CW1]|uniref:Alpha/beta fold hydrolase n=1 Tax=Natronospira elongata TaxID=3110268 RepID=A0AAP6JE21_9GAMM|nr:alpha/beta fold hydrolase [Gammaproteobacteria bacterium AB-CW1]